MKYILLASLLALQLYAVDEIDQEIQKATNVDELNSQMQRSPTRYRHRYIQAIKDRVALENESKREALMSKLNMQKSEETQNQHINALTGSGSSSDSDSSRGGRGKGSNGNGGRGGGGGGGRGGGK